MVMVVLHVVLDWDLMQNFAQSVELEH